MLRISVRNAIKEIVPGMGCLAVTKDMQGFEKGIALNGLKRHIGEKKCEKILLQNVSVTRVCTFRRYATTSFLDCSSILKS